MRLDRVWTVPADYEVESVVFSCVDRSGGSRGGVGHGLFRRVTRSKVRLDRVWTVLADHEVDQAWTVPAGHEVESKTVFSVIDYGAKVYWDLTILSPTSLSITVT